MFRDEPMTSEEIWRMKISKSPKMSTGVPVPGVDTQLRGGVNLLLPSAQQSAACS
jgi:hypothetical protein